MTATAALASPICENLRKRQEIQKSKVLVIKWLIHHLYTLVFLITFNLQSNDRVILCTAICTQTRIFITFLRIIFISVTAFTRFTAISLFPYKYTHPTPIMSNNLKFQSLLLFKTNKFIQFLFSFMTPDYFFAYPEPEEEEYHQSDFQMTENPKPTINNKRKEEEQQQPIDEKKKKNTVFNELLTSLLLLEEEDETMKSEQMQQNPSLKNQSFINSYSDFNEPNDQFLMKKPKLSSINQIVTTHVADKSKMDSCNGGIGVGSGLHRRLWVKDRSKAWWEQCNHPDFPESEFKKAFRMSKATFNLICEELNSSVEKEDTMLRAAIPVRQRVAVCIWRLATGEPLRLVSKRFGLGISTCHKLVLEVCSAIKTVLMPRYLQWPNEERLQKNKKDFESISKIPNVVGSMYTTHIPIIAPKISVSAYFNKRHTERNQKTCYSITVQGVVDSRGVFNDVCIGWPGSMSDEQILEKSVLCQRANGGELNGVWIVGSSSYPLMDWVLVPYSQMNLTWTQHAFNEKIGEVQGIGRNAFARLKGRWGCLQKRTEMKLQDLPVVLGACCVLHNICELMNDEVDPELNLELFDDEMVPENSFRSVRSTEARDTIAHNLLHHGLAGTSFS